MIGEQFTYGDEICGAVVNVRSKQEKIALWTKNAANQTAQVPALLEKLFFRSDNNSFSCCGIFSRLSCLHMLMLDLILG